MMSLSIVIPAFNEAKSLEEFLPAVLKFSIVHNFELIIVNDGSTDNTRLILEELNDNNFIKVINNKQNLGYGAAIKAGILRATSDFIITIDADGQHRLEDVLCLFNCIITNDADLVIGGRKGQKSVTRFRSLGKSIIRRFAKLYMDIPIYDINSGMKIYKSALAKRYIRFAPDGMAFSDIMTIVFVNSKRLVIEEPIIIKQRIAGESTISYQTAFQTIKEITIIATTFFPLKFFGSLAALMFLISFGWGLPFLLQNKGFTTGTTLGLLFSSLFLVLGILAELIALIRKDLIENL